MIRTEFYKTLEGSGSPYLCFNPLSLKSVALDCYENRRCQDFALFAAFEQSGLTGARNGHVAILGWLVNVEAVKAPLHWLIGVHRCSL